MNVFTVFRKNRKDLIQALKFSYFLSETCKDLKNKYSKTKNPLIQNFLKFLNWFNSWHWDRVNDYIQLLTDYPFWTSREYYREQIRKVLEYELSALDFVAETIYPIRSHTREGLDLKENFRLQATIELAPKSLGFSISLLGLTAILEGFDEDPEESFFTEDELRAVIQKVGIKLEKYFIQSNNDNFLLQFIVLFFIGITGMSYLVLKPELLNLFSQYFNIQGTDLAFRYFPFLVENFPWYQRC